MTVDIPAPQERQCRVFVSYTHDNEPHKAAVREFCAFLSSQPGITVIADFQVKPRIAWGFWARRQIATSDFTIAIASPKYRQAGSATETAPEGHLGIQNEIHFLDELLTRDRRAWTPRILPVVLPNGSPEHIPDFLFPRSTGYFIVSAFTTEDAADLLAAMTCPPGDGDAPRWSSPISELERHWWPAARGTTTTTRNWYFTGRKHAMAEIKDFTNTAEQGLCAVTGMPGVGKSALLAALVLRSLRQTDLPPNLRKEIPDCDIDVALFAGGKSPRELVTRLADTLGVPRLDWDSPVESLMSWLDAQSGRHTVVIDALDEAALPSADDRAGFDLLDLLSELAWRVRLIIGVRSELSGPGDPRAALPAGLRSQVTRVIDLNDTDRYLSDDDVAEYIAGLLRTDRRPGGYGYDDPADPAKWTDVGTVMRIAREATGKTKGNFLIAQFIAEELLATAPLTGAESGWSEQMRWPDRLEDWLARDIDRRLGGKESWVRELLVPIALAQQGGLPMDLWLKLAQAFERPREITERDLRHALELFTFFVGEAGGSVPRFSMRHASFARFFAGRWPERRVELFFETLLASVPTEEGARQWQQVSDYVRVNLLTHAQRAGRIETLIAEEPACLAAVDPDTAIVPLTGLQSPRARQATMVYRRAAYALDGQFGERVAALRFHSQLIAADEMAEALELLDPQQPWSTPWRAGGMPSTIPLGNAETASWVLPVPGPHGEPAALLVRPNGRCVLVDAATQSRLGPTLALTGPGAEPPDIVKAWAEESGDVRIAVLEQSGEISIWTAAGPTASGRRSESIHPATPPERLEVIGGPRGLRLLCASGGDTGGLTVWPIGRTVPLATPGDHGGFLAPVAATADLGALVTAAAIGMVRLWRFPPNAAPEAQSLTIGEGLRGLAATGTAQGGCVLVDDGSSHRILWFSDTGPLVDSGHQLGEGGAPTRVAITWIGAGARVAMTEGGYGNVAISVLRPAESPRVVSRLDTRHVIRQLSFLDDAGTLLAATDWNGVIHIYALDDPATPRLITSIPTGENATNLLVLGMSAQGPLLATRAIAGMTKFWQVDPPSDAHVSAPIDQMRCARYQEDEGVLATTTENGSEVRVWHATPDAPHPAVTLRHGEPIECIAITTDPGGIPMVCAAGAERVTLWQVRDGLRGAVLRSWPTNGNPLERLAVIAVGGLRLVCAAGPESLTLWDAVGDRSVEPLFAEPDIPVSDLIWFERSDGEATIVAATEDGPIHLVTVDHSARVRRTVLDQGEAVEQVVATATADGRHLLASVRRDGQIIIWDAEAEAEEARMGALPLQIPGVQVAWTDDRGNGDGDPILVIAEPNGPVRLVNVFDPCDQRFPQQFDGPGGRVRHLAVGSDGQVACSFAAGSVLFAGVRDRDAVVARLNCDLTDPAWIPGTRWLVGAQGSALVALRRGADGGRTG
ncbi:TIR domain-containing protein [Nonomuraea sp. NPDC052129]|uniref:nSTAND1 domain-containing NTPase n=1 Tax=Nonomuraea sp. NPDC052129 TaxID=3154651 RepID=UPI0034147B67